MIVATADHTARRIGSSTKRRSARMPRKAKRRTAVVVSRGSQSHHTPHVGFAQIAPGQQRRKQSRTPTSIDASRRASHFQSLRKRNASAAKKPKVMASSAFQ